MTVTLDDIRDELEVDFGLARHELTEARMRQLHKDTPQHRVAVADCWARIDTILDLFLQVQRTSRLPPLTATV
jgi:hypothetical protein